MTDPTHRRRGRRFGRLLITTTRQAAGAPLIDGASMGDAEGHNYGGYVIRRPGAGDRPTEALALGWRDAMTPWPLRSRLRMWRYRLARRRVWPALAHVLDWLGSDGAPLCDGCGIPITGESRFGGDDAPDLCRWCGISCEANGTASVTAEP